MLPWQTSPPPQPTVGGLGILDFLRGLGENLSNDWWQTGIALLLTGIAVGVLTKHFGVPAWMAAPAGAGIFWVAWQLYGNYVDGTKPLFPGGFQATNPWQVFVEDGGGGRFVILVIFVLFMIWKVLKKSMNLVVKIAVVVFSLFGVSLIFNFIDGFELPTRH